MNQAPIFQIESNMGWVSAVQEMIFTSRPSVIKLLPALPNAWPEGEIKGMRARGNITINEMSWENGGSKIKANIISGTAQQVSVVTEKNIKELKINGRTQKFIDNKFSINLKSGKVYSLDILL